MNKTTLTFGERTFELTFYAQHTIVMHSANTMYLSHSAGSGISHVSAGRLISWSLLYKAWIAGAYTPETPEFAELLRNYKDLSFRIASIKEINLYADAAVSVGTLPPCDFVEIMLEFTWTDAKGKAYIRLAEMPFIVVTPAQFAGQ